MPLFATAIKLFFEILAQSHSFRNIYDGGNLDPRVFSVFNMAAARENTLGDSDLKRSLTGTILT